MPILTTLSDSDFFLPLPYLASRIARRSCELGFIYQLDLDKKPANHHCPLDTLRNIGPPHSCDVYTFCLASARTARLYDYEDVGDWGTQAEPIEMY